MSKNSYYDLPDRRSARLQSYDYRQPGYYYVTICVSQRRCLLSNITNSQVHLSPAGSIVQSEWDKLPERFQHVHLDQHVIMPNHFHGIIVFEEPQKVLPDTAKENKLPFLGEVVRIFKGASTYHIRKTSCPDFAWEGRLYEHVIRNNSDLTRIQEYIFNNPASWREDTLYQLPR